MSNTKSNVFARHKKLWIVIAVIIVALIAFLFIRQSAAGQGGAKNSDVPTMALTKMDIEQIVTATGAVKSLDSRSVSAPASLNAPVASVKVKVGQKVSKGDTLCTFDTQMLDINIAAAEESLVSANAQSSLSIKQAKRRVADAQKQYNDDKKRLDKEVSKAKKQLDASKKKDSSGGKSTASTGAGLPGIGTTDGTGAAGATGATAKSAYEAAKSTREQTLKADKAQITSAKDALETQQLMDSAAQIQSQLDVYEQQKKDTVIKSPIDGTITAANATTGSYPGMESPLFVVENLENLEVTALVPEYDAAILETGLSVDIISDAIQNGSWRGEIKSISPVASDVNGNFTVTVSVMTELGSLKSGMSAKLNIVTDSRQNVFAVPYGALGENEAGESILYVIDSGAGADTASGTGAGTDTDSKQAGKDTQSGAAGNAAAKDVKLREVIVTTGLETDYYIEVSGAELAEGMLILTDPDEVNTDEPVDISESMGPGAFGGE